MSEPYFTSQHFEQVRAAGHKGDEDYFCSDITSLNKQLESDDPAALPAHSPAASLDKSFPLYC